MMEAGNLRHKVVFERAVEVASTFNENRKVWGSLKEAWADITPVSGREFFAMQAAQSDVTHQISVRYFPGLSPKDRIKYVVGCNGTAITRFFDIRVVINEKEKNMWYRLMCVEHGVQSPETIQ